MIAVLVRFIRRFSLRLRVFSLENEIYALRDHLEDHPNSMVDRDRMYDAIAELQALHLEMKS
jgi:anaerobic glycerol-3-phosphate dehydrogenase